MTRWHTERKEEVEAPMVDAFIEDLIQVYQKHGLSLGHEDHHGGFIVEKLSPVNVEWVRGAMTEVP